MKRSEINQAHRDAIACFEAHRWALHARRLSRRRVAIEPVTRPSRVSTVPTGEPCPQPLMHVISAERFGEASSSPMDREDRCAGGQRAVQPHERVFQPCSVDVIQHL